MSSPLNDARFALRRLLWRLAGPADLGVAGPPAASRVHTTYAQAAGPTVSLISAGPAAPSTSAGARSYEVARAPGELGRLESSSRSPGASRQRSSEHRQRIARVLATSIARSNAPHHPQSRLRVVEHHSHHPHSHLFDVLEPLLTLVLAALLAALVLGNVGCACGPSTPSDPPPAVVRVSPAPSWWAPTSSGAILSASTSGGEFTLQETTSTGTRVLFRKETNYGALQVEREPTHGGFILVGLHPDRVPVLYTAFLPGLPPVEFFRCAPTRPAAHVSVGGADATGFWVSLDADCSGTTDGALLVRIQLINGALRARTSVPFGGPSPLESRRVLLHPTERLAAVFDADATRLLRFDEAGHATASAPLPAQPSKVVGFLSDAPALLTIDAADAGLVSTEQVFGDGGVETTACPLAVATSERAVALGGDRRAAWMLVQGRVDVAHREQTWRVLARADGKVTAREGVTGLGDLVRVALAPDAGVFAIGGRVLRGGGGPTLELTQVALH